MNTVVTPDWFTELYSPVTVNDAEQTSRRYRGVVAAARVADAELIGVALKLAIEWHVPLSNDAKARFRGFFNKADDQFPESGNELEVRLLAVALLRKLTEGGALAPLAALSLNTATLGGARNETLSTSLASQSNVALMRLAHERRVRPRLDELAAQEPQKIDFEKAAAAATDDDVPKAITLMGEAVRAAFRASNAKQSAAITQVHQFLKTQDDELQVLWWLMGGMSPNGGVPFDEVPDAIRPIVLAADLADCTTTDVGLPALDGFLVRAELGADAQCKLVDVVNALPRDLSETLVREISPDVVTLPIHLALARSLETADKHKWIDGWAAATGLPADVQMDALSLAKQFYRERLVAWAD